ncbi:ApeA N-terminal domain 1-containing protein [Parafannyhessea umbonata]|uniref:ApeA N-terminal domain 1-containing protein n=1 Tax=Parafannyhessea umbonata TaxID=604330 RepID=UPI00117EC6E4|nr:HEPN domain-containing protein [Parafannyhessea umbonata]
MKALAVRGSEQISSVLVEGYSKVEDSRIGAGLWAFSWDALDAPGDCVQGSVEYSGGHVLLDIPFGELLGTPGVVVIGGPPQPPNYVDHVFGFTRTGFYAVLINARYAGGTASIPGGSSQSVDADSLLLSRVRFDPLEYVRKMELGLKGLNEWAGLFPASVSFDKETHMLRSVQVDLERDKDNRVLMDDAWMKIELFHTLSSSSISVEGISIRHDCKLSIVFKEPVPLDGAIATASLLERFFSFCTEQLAEVVDLHVWFAEHEERVDCYYPFPQARQEDKKLDSREVPLRYAVFESGIPEILERWINAEGGLKTARDIVSSFDAGKWDLPLSNAFVVASQALEGLTKYGIDLHSLDPQVYKRYRKIALDSIAEQEVREWVTMRLNGNSKGQSTLFDELYERHSEVFEWLIPGGAGEFFKVQKDIRNSSIHPGGTRRESSSPRNDVDIYWHMRCCTLICKLVVAKLMGFEFDKVIESLKHNNKWAVVIRHARDMYSSKPRNE